MSSIDEITIQLQTIATNHKLDPNDNRILAALLDATALGMKEARTAFMETTA
jgi:hypothetical protein